MPKRRRTKSTSKRLDLEAPELRCVSTEDLVAILSRETRDLLPQEVDLLVERRALVVGAGCARVTSAKQQSVRPKCFIDALHQGIGIGERVSLRFRDAAQLRDFDPD